jgi:hypothetical protein
VDNFSEKRLSGIYGFAKLAPVAKKERSSVVLMLQSYFMKSTPLELRKNQR